MSSDKDGAIYIANMANKTAAPTEPSAMLLRDAAPVNGTADVPDGFPVMVAFEMPTELNVVAAAPPATPPAWDAAVVAATRAAPVVTPPATVVNCT